MGFADASVPINVIYVYAEIVYITNNLVTNFKRVDLNNNYEYRFGYSFHCTLHNFFFKICSTFVVLN